MKYHKIMQENMLPVGTIIKSPEAEYRVVKVLGQGGFGITYLAESWEIVRNTRHKLLFALKELFLSDFCSREHATGRVCYSDPASTKVEGCKADFIAEATRLSRIKHPNVVSVTEVFETNGTAYYAMEYIEGKSLRSHVKAVGALDEKQMLNIINPILNAVGYLHNNRITHLDIKPDNLMLRTDDMTGEMSPILIDFGLSKHYDEKGNATSTIRIQGCSDGYAPMEQYLGIRTFTPQADVYAIGATMLFCLTGKDPIKADELSGEWVKSALPATISPTVAGAVTHALCVMRNKRTPDIATLKRELSLTDEAIVVSEVVSENDSDHETEIIDKKGTSENKTETISVGKSVKSRTNKPKKNFLLPLIIIVGIIIIAITCFFLFRGSDNTPQPTPSDTSASATQYDYYVDTPDTIVDSQQSLIETIDPKEEQYRIDLDEVNTLYLQGKYEQCKSKCQQLNSTYPSHSAEIQIIIDNCDNAITNAEYAAKEQQYTREYNAALALYNQGKYSECKSKCQTLISKYANHRSELNSLITRCDNAIAEGERVAKEQQYTREYNAALALYNQGKYSECKSKCQTLISKYSNHQSELNSLIAKCESELNKTTIKGTVISSWDGGALSGATITPIGGGSSVMTDYSGSFTLSVGSNVKKIKISYSGYISKEVYVSTADRSFKLDLEIKGTVVDENGEPMPGATVMIKNTYSGVATDIDGNFTIIPPYKAQKLVVSYVEYRTQEINISDISGRIVIKMRKK